MSYLKHLQMQRQLEEKAKEERETREQAGNELKKAEETIERAKKIDASTADVEAILEEARAATSAKDYKVALEKAQEAREKASKAFRDRVKAIVDSSGTMLELARSIGEEASAGADHHEGAVDALKRGEMDTAVELANKAWKATEKGLYEHLSNAFSQAQALILTAKNSGKDISIPEDLLSRARTALEENDYESAMGFTRDCLENVSSALSDDVTTALESAHSLLVLAKNLQAEVGKPEDILERARQELEVLDFEKAMNSTKQASSDLKRVIQKGVEDGVVAIRSELEEASGLGADVAGVSDQLPQAEEKLKADDYHGAVEVLRKAYEDVTGAKFQVVLNTISQSKEKFQTAMKIGADINEAMDLLNKARESLNAGSFQEALDYARRSDDEVDNLVKEFHDVEDRIRALQDRFTFADEKGVDIARARSLLENARLALQARDFGRVLEFVRQCEEATDKAEYEHTMKTVEASERAITLGERMGLDMAEANKSLEQAIVATKAKDYETAIEDATKSLSETGRLLEETILETISQFQDAIPLAGKEGVKAKKLFDKAESAFAAEDYEKAWRFASDGVAILDGLVRETSEAILESIDLAEKLARTLEVDLPDMSETKSDAQALGDGGTYRDMLRVTEKHKSRLGALMDTLFDKVKSQVVEARNLKLDTDGMVAQLKEAKIAQGSDDYLTGLRNMMEVSVEASEGLDLHHRAYNAMSSTAAAVAEAKKKGVDVSNVLQSLLEAKKLFESGRLEGAIALAEEAKGETEGVMALYAAAQNITEARNSLEVAESLGLNVASILKVLEDAKAAMKERSYRNALELSGRVKVQASEFLGENVSGLVSTTGALIEEAREKGYPTEKAEKSIEAAREHLAGGTFDEAAKAALKARRRIERLRVQRDEAREALRTAQAALAEVEAMNAEAPRSKAFMQRAAKALEDKRFKEVIELGARVLEEVDVEQKAHITQTIAQFEEAVKKARAEGTNTQSAERLIKQAKKHLAGGRFREALELAMQSENEMERVGLQQEMATKALETARKKIDSFGAPVPAALDLIAEAEAFYDEGDYVQALELAIRSGDEFQRLAQAWEQARERVELATELHEAAKAVGAEVSNAAGLLTSARDDLGAGESELAIAKADEAARFLSEETRKVVESVIGVLQERKALCDELDVQVSGFDQFVSDANALMEEAEFLRAHEQAVAARTAADKALSSRAAEVFANSKAAVAHAKKMGADVSESVGLLKESRSALKAGDYRLGLDLAAKSVEVVESSRKKEKEYIDLTYQADLTISSAKRFGINVDAAESKLLEAIEAKTADMRGAIGLAEEALSLAKEAVEAFTPDIEAELTVESPQIDEWSDASLTLTNLSKALAKDVSVKIMGDAEVDGMDQIPSVRGGGSHTAGFRIRMSAGGTVPLNIQVTSHRVMDGKEYSHESLAEVHVGAVDEEVTIPEEEEELVAREEAKCALCMGSIKVGMEMMRHSCGTLFHQTCGGRVEECPTCGQAM